jgi:membrane protein DedA with SNARE-associated domain
MEFLQLIQDALVQYGWLGLFAGAFLFGETIIISSALIVFSQGLSVPLAVGLAFLGTVLSDLIWFLLGSSVVRRRLERNGTWDKHHDFIARLNQLFGKRPFLILLVIKFLYGTRILTIVYLSVRKMPIWQFLFFNSLGTILWLSVLFGLSKAAVETAMSVGDTLGTIQIVIVSGVVVFIVIKLLNLWITKRLENK